MLLTFFFFSLKNGLFEIWLNLGQALLLLCLAVSEVGEEVEGESGEEDAGGGNYPTEVQRKKINSTTALKIRYRAKY